MIHYYNLFFERVKFPLQAEQFLLSSGEKVITTYGREWGCVIDEFYNNEFVLETIEGKIEEISSYLCLHPYTTMMVFLICATGKLKEEYQKSGYDEELFWETMTDFRSKAEECYYTKGVWGTFVAFWYPNFFRLKIFRMGRLIFERDTFREQCSVEIAGRKILPEDKVINVHIPSGGSLDQESCLNSFKKAYRFFRDEFSGQPVLFRCGSWLLYPENRKILPLESNVIKFMEFWKIYKSREEWDFPDLWRIFGVEYPIDLKKLPRETTMQKAFYDWFIAGGVMGAGAGIMAYDGKKIRKE